MEENVLGTAIRGGDASMNDNRIKICGGDHVKFRGSLIAYYISASLMILAFGGLAGPSDELANEELVFGPNVRVDDTGFQLSDQVYPDIAVDDMGVIYVVWYDDRNLISAYHDIYLAKSSNGGISFDTNIQVDDGGQFTTQMNPSVTVDKSGAVYVAWQDYRNGNWDIYLAKSIDGGLSFGPSARVDDTGNDTSNQAIPSVEVAQNGTVFVVWHDHASNSIKLSRSLDGGATFEPSVLVNDPLGSPALTVPSLTLDAQGNIFVSWSGKRDGFYHIYLSKSTDGGLFFGPDLQVDDASYGVRSGSSIGADSAGNVYAVWMDSRNSSNGIYFTKSTDGGSTFEKNIRVDNIGTGAVITSGPSLGVDSVGNVYVTWDDNRNNNQRDIFFASSLDGGFSFEGDIRVDDTGSTVSGQWSPSIAIFENNSTSHVFITWFDKRNGNWDIYFAATQLSLLPDLTVESQDMHFQPNTVNLGDSVTINATIHNRGHTGVPDLTVRFYDGIPAPVNQIGPDVVIPYIGRFGTAEAEVMWNPSTIGTHEVFVLVDPDNMVPERNETNNEASRSITVHYDIPPPPNLIATVVGNDVQLDWTAPSVPNIAYYLVYRSTSQTTFDFNDPVHNTSFDMDPLATTWIDVDGASASSPPEYYYAVRTVSKFGSLSISSITVGKWTKDFEPGTNTFSFPLDLCEDLNISWFADDIPGAEYVRWLDINGRWVTHYRGSGEGVNDAPAEVGETYEIGLKSPTTYTFTGYPGSMIRFREGMGSQTNFTRSLRVQMQTANVKLSWNATPNVQEYWIFRSNKRTGLHNLSLEPVAKLSWAATTWTDFGAVNLQGESYYTLMPVDLSGRFGSSTYSVGVVTVGYLPGIRSFGLPLKPIEIHTADWFCQNIPDIIGIAHMMSNLWVFHATTMPEGVYDTQVSLGGGYQISVQTGSAKHSFVGL